jgi:hypothetical protein
VLDGHIHQPESHEHDDDVADDHPDGGGARTAGPGGDDSRERGDRRLYGDDGEDLGTARPQRRR